MDGTPIESRIIEIGIDSSAVQAGIERMQAQLGELDASFERTGRIGSEALTSIERRLLPAADGFSALARQVRQYASALEMANSAARDFRPPTLPQTTYQEPTYSQPEPIRPTYRLNSRGQLIDEKGRYVKRNDAESAYDDYAQHSASAPFRQQYNADDPQIRNVPPAFVGDPYEPVLGGRLAPIYPTRNPAAGLGDPLWRASDPVTTRNIGSFDDPFGTYGVGDANALRDKYQGQLDALKVRRQVMDEWSAQQSRLDQFPDFAKDQGVMSRRELEGMRWDALAAFGGSQPDANGLYTPRAQSQFSSTDTFVDSLRNGRNAVQAEAQLGIEAEQLREQANRVRSQYGNGADIYSDGSVKYRNAAGELVTLNGNVKKSTDELADSMGNLGGKGGGGGVMGSLEYSMLRSFAVMGVMWGGINLLQQGMEQWIANNVEADYTMNMLGYTTERTRNEIAGITREAMALSAGYGISPQQSLPATLLASRASGDPAEIVARVRGSAQMSMITGQGQEQAMESLIDLQRKWNLEGTETERINNVIAVAYKNTIAPLDQFSEALVRMSAFGRENNLTLEQTAGLIAGFMNSTGISEPSRAETFFEVIGGIQKQPQNVQMLQQQGFSIYNEEGEFLKTTELINNIAVAWSGMSEEEQKSTALALVGRQRLNEALDYFNAYSTKAAETMQKFNDTVGAGTKIDEARGESLRQMWAEFTAGIDAAMSDPEIMRFFSGKSQTEMSLRSQFNVPDNIEIPESIINLQRNTPGFQKEQTDAAIRAWLSAMQDPIQETGIDQYRKAWSDSYRNQPTSITPQLSTQAQMLIENYGNFRQLDMTGAQFDTAAVEAQHQAAARLDQAARQQASSESEIEGIKTRINEKMEQTLVLYQLQGGEVRTMRADVAALLEEQAKAVRLPSFQNADMTSSELDVAINRAKGLAAQYKVTVEGAGFSTKGIEDEWNKTSIAIRTSDGALRVLTGNAAVFLSQALQIGRAVEQWQAPGFQITQQTPGDFARTSTVAQTLAKQYEAGVRASNIPLEEQDRILKEAHDQWSKSVQIIHLADGSIRVATASTAAWYNQAAGLVSAFDAAAEAAKKASQIHPNIQTMPELNAQLAGQLQQYLVQYENLLRAMNVAQTPQQYMIFGQGGSMYQFVTSADAMQLAMALLQEQIAYNTAASQDATDATKENTKKSDQLRGSYNLPTEWGYRPPTAWEYYDDAKKAGRQVAMGPVNYPWMFPDENGADGGQSALSKFLAQPHLGLVPGAAGKLLPTTFGDSLPDPLSPAQRAILDGGLKVDEGGTKILQAANLLTGGASKESNLSERHLLEEQNRTNSGIGMRTSPLGFDIGAFRDSLMQAIPKVVAPQTKEESQFVDPLRGKGKYVQGFGEHPENYKQFGLPGHDGMDFAAPQGTRVYPVAPGTITSVGYGKDYGYQVWERLANGIDILYAHLAQQPNVTAGQKVDANTLLGLVGRTGNSTGPHLHLGMKPNDGTQPPGFNGFDNPAELFGKEGISLKGMPQLQTSSNAISTNTAALVTSVPQGLNGIASGVTGSNALLSQMAAYLLRIATNTGRPPTVNVYADSHTTVDTEVKSGAFGQGSAIGSGAFGAGGTLGGGIQ